MTLTAQPSIGTHNDRLLIPLATLARGLAGFCGVMTLLNILGELRVPHFDASLWWFDLRLLPAPLARWLLGAAGYLWLAYAIRPMMAPWRRTATWLATLSAIAITLANASAFYVLRANGIITTPVWMPFSACLMLALLVILAGMRPGVALAPMRRRHLLGVLLACAISLPLAQIYTFGMTDYSRRADVIVVFGAKVYADGAPSTALSDRVRTACALYRAGLAQRLLFSGGPGDGATTEPQAMRAMALHRGVPDAAIILDEHGLDTRATVRNSLPLFRRNGVRRVLAVSHFCHLPRIKMAYQRAGWNVCTVPVRDGQMRAGVPFQVLREIAAQWAYYLSPLWGG